MGFRFICSCIPIGNCYEEKPASVIIFTKYHLIGVAIPNMKHEYCSVVEIHVHIFGDAWCNFGMFHPYPTDDLQDCVIPKTPQILPKLVCVVGKYINLLFNCP